MTTREFEDVTLPGIEEGEILVIRSKRRKKSISAYRQGGRIVISIPARMTKADERSIVPEMIAKIRSQEAAKTPQEADLAARIDSLLTELAPEITERPVSVTWRAMRERWGSCTSCGYDYPHLRSPQIGPRICSGLRSLPRSDSPSPL